MLEGREAAAVEGRPPGIIGAVVTGIRTQLAQQGYWAEVVADLEERLPAAAEEVVAVSRWRTVDVATHIALLDSAAAVLGEEGMREFGRQRLSSEVSHGLFATLARSWLRTFRARPQELFRMAPYMWRVATRNCGVMHVADVHEDHLRGRLRDAPPRLVHSKAWGWMIEGMGEGLLGLAELFGTVRGEVVAGETGAYDLVARWRA